MNYEFESPMLSIVELAIAFLLGCVVLAVTSRRIRLTPSRVCLRSVFRDEDGAAYSLSLVIALPFYMIVLATITECALMIVVKLGTMNAAYAAARSAIVWKAAEVDPDRQDEMIHWAAAQAMTPFASSAQRHLEPTGDAFPNADAGARAYYDAYRAYSGGGAPSDYLARKLRFALAATEVEIETDDLALEPDYTANLRVTVTYEKPIDVPLVGTFMGSRATWAGARFFSRKIKTTLVLQKEGAKSDSRTLGINYDSWNY